MVFYPAVGYGVFWIALIASIVIYIMMRKWYPLVYLISAALYIFTVAFVIDVFDLDKNAIILVLAFSAFLMIGMGWFIAKKVSK